VAAETLRRNRIGGGTVAAVKIMSAPDKPTPPDFDDDYLQAIAKWREQNKIKDDDPILLLMDLFRIHQNHWDELRHRQMPSLDEFQAGHGRACGSDEYFEGKSIERSPRG
jgi:hypothetical protein